MSKQNSIASTGKKKSLKEELIKLSIDKLTNLISGNIALRVKISDRNLRILNVEDLKVV